MRWFRTILTLPSTFRSKETEEVPSVYKKYSMGENLKEILKKQRSKLRLHLVEFRKSGFKKIKKIPER